MTQRERLADYFSHHDLARAAELRAHGVSGASLARALEKGDVKRVRRGLYRSPDMKFDIDVSFAKAAKCRPNGVICMVSVFRFHNLIDWVPDQVWMAIGARDWAPNYRLVEFARFREPYFSSGVETTVINGVTVKIYSITKSLADAFRNHQSVEINVAIAALRSVLARRIASPETIYREACRYGAGKAMRPYLEALAANA